MTTPQGDPDAESPAGEQWGPPSSILGARLATQEDGPLPTPSELGLEDAKTSAFAWQTERNFAKLADIGASLSGRAGARWVVETHGILGVIGEQVLVAIEAEIEKDLVRRALVALPTTTVEHKSAVSAHLSRSLRFFAEGQGNAVVIGLHGLINLFARTLEFDADLSASELQMLGVSRTEFAPGATARNAWLSWSASKISQLVTMASTRSTVTQAFAHEVAKVSQEQAIVDLLELRNTQYHRWRGESAGVTGIAHGEPPAIDVLASGQAVTIGKDMLPPYTAGQATLSGLVKVSRDALDAFSAHMDTLLAVWAPTVPRQ